MLRWIAGAVGVLALGCAAPAGPSTAERPPTRLLAELGSRRYAVPDEVLGLAVSADGRTAAVGTAKDVLLVDLATGTIARHLEGVRGAVLAWAPDGASVAVGGDDEVFLVDAVQGAVRARLDLPGGVLALGFSPTGDQLAVGTTARELRLYDAAGAELKAWRYKVPVGAVAWAPDGARLYVANGQEVEVRTPAGKRLGTVRGHTHTVDALAVSADGARLATGGWDGTVRLWDAATRGAIRALHGDGERVTDVLWAPDGTVLSGGTGPAVTVWDPGADLAVATIDAGAPPRGLALAADGVLVVGGKHRLRRWKIDLRASLPEPGHEGSVDALGWLDDDRLATSGADATVRLWRLSTRAQERVLIGLGGLDEVEGLPRGPRAVIEEGAVRVGAVALPAHREAPLATALSPDGARVAVGYLDGLVRVHPLAPGAEAVEARLAWRVEALAWSPDGTVLAASGEDRWVWLWDPATGAELARLGGEGGFTGALAFSPDGTRLAAGARDGTVRVWAAP